MPQIKFCWVSVPQTAHRTALSHPKQIYYSNHLHSLTSIQAGFLGNANLF